MPFITKIKCFYLLTEVHYDKNTNRYYITLRKTKDQKTNKLVKPLTEYLVSKNFKVNINSESTDYTKVSWNYWYED